MFETDSLGGALSGISPRWYVAQTKRHRERVADSMLGRHFETYLPLIQEDPPPAVGSSIAPMFPCYIFVRAALAEGYHRILRTPGIKDLVRTAGEPGVVSEEVIGFLRAKEGPDGVVRPGHALNHGCQVEIVRGVFRGLDAVVDEPLPGRERVRILLSLFQREARVEIPSGWVRQR
jgi:transcription antitermination factor NusG